MKVLFAKTLFHKYGLRKYIENWPNIVLFKGIDSRLPVQRVSFLGFRVYKL